MKKFKIKTKALMEQTYIIEAETEEQAKQIAIDNTEDVVEQTVVGQAEILEVVETE